MEAILLRGDHPTLPEAELRALVAVHGGAIQTLAPRVRLAPHGDKMALAASWGTFHAAANDTAEGLAACSIGWSNPGGSFAVRAERTGTKRSLSRRDVERALGTNIPGDVELKHPEHQAFAWLGEGKIVTGWLQGSATSVESRSVEGRAHFSPVALHPRRARGLLHLARVPPGGSVLDPFCGTGTFVLEAALEGHAVTASDIDSWMVQGTLQTLTDATEEPLDARAFVADIGHVPALIDPVDGIVTDLPYGRASTTEGEDLKALYKRTMAAFAQLLPSGRYAVIGTANPEWLPTDGFALREHHQERVHKSLTRHYLVLQRD